MTRTEKALADLEDTLGIDSLSELQRTMIRTLVEAVKYDERVRCAAVADAYANDTGCSVEPPFQARRDGARVVAAEIRALR